MTTGVVLVAFNADEIIVECLESLLASTGADLRIVVVDNCSRDTTSQTLRSWAQGEVPLPPPEAPHAFTPLAHGKITLVEDPAGLRHLGAGEVGLIRSETNLGFAGGVNLGLELLQANPEVEYFWVLNPDCTTQDTTAARLEARARAEGRFGVIGGRIFYSYHGDVIQSDGGRVNMWSGICVPYNLLQLAQNAPVPSEASLDYIAGAHMFLSRDFLQQAGFMPEDYFLYYEEIDWCFRRGDLPLLFEKDAVVYHLGGHTIGSATKDKGPSPLSAYFLNRARRKFIARYRPLALPVTALYSTARALRSLLQGHSAAGKAALRGIWGLAPTREMLEKIGLEALPAPRDRRKG
jgi:GT2 family glycosyltransferase